MPAIPSASWPGLSPTVSAQQTVEPGISGQYGVGDSAASISFDIEWGSLPVFLYQVLGFVRSGGAGAYPVWHTLPAQHPECPWMYASRVVINHGNGPTGYAASTNQGSGTKTGTYRSLRVTVQYEAPPYFISNIENPPTAFTYVEIDPAAEFITRQQGSFCWPAASPLGLQRLSAQASQSVSQLVSKIKMKLVWVLVPDQGLFGDGGFPASLGATNIGAAVGTVNEDTFFGCEPGTLLCTGWHPRPRTLPVLASQIGANIKLPRVWDVEIYLSYFNPPPGANGVLGHNLVPAASGGKWWRVFLSSSDPPNAADDVSANWRYQTSTFANMFKMLA